MKKIKISQRGMDALDKSIKHWKNLRDGKEHVIGSAECALCVEFSHVYPGELCKECPVKKVTGQDDCRGTPYHDIMEIAEFSRLKTDKDPYAYALACAELAFLEAVKELCEVK